MRYSMGKGKRSLRRLPISNCPPCPQQDSGVNVGGKDGDAEGTGVKVLVAVGGLVGDNVLVDLAGIGELLIVGITSMSSSISPPGEQAQVPNIKNRLKRDNFSSLNGATIISGSVYQKRFVTSMSNWDDVYLECSSGRTDYGKIIRITN